MIKLQELDTTTNLNDYINEEPSMVKFKNQLNEITKKLKIVTVGGMIGVGKTTHIQNQLKLDKEKGIKSKCVFELFEENKDSIFDKRMPIDDNMDLLLKMYYENVEFLNNPDDERRTQALVVTLSHQMNFLSTRATKIINAIKIAERQDLDVLYLDRTIFEDIIFVKRNLFNEPLYFLPYFEVWKLWFNLISHTLKGYDVTNIILEASEETILDRIKKRGREMEQGEDVVDYFKDLNANYVKELKSNFISKKWDFIVINNED